MSNDRNQADAFDHGTHKEFVDYYAEQSLSDSSMERMKGIFDCINRNLKTRGISDNLKIADIGCGAGIMSLFWAREGHAVSGLDVNEALLTIARQRAIEAELEIEFCLGSATNLPWDDESMDVCIAPELLEHIEDWQTCIKEFVRILKPNGLLFISTANKLCPKQQEFNLPFYSWYPDPLKRYFVKLAKTTRPEIAGYAKYPAVNWFSYYQLRKEFAELGMSTLDRFALMDLKNKPEYQKLIIKTIQQHEALRWLGHVMTPGLLMIAIKNGNA